MATVCRTCASAHRAQVELGLAHRVPVRTLGRKFGLTKESLYRHRKNHMPPQLMAALMKAGKPTDVDLEALKHAESEGLLQHLVVQRAHLYRLADQAEQLGDLRAVAQLHGRLSENLTLTAKLLGELRTASQTVIQNVLLTPEYVALRSALINALRPFPDARQAITKVFQSAEAKVTEATREAITAAA